MEKKAFIVKGSFHCVLHPVASLSWDWFSQQTWEEVPFTWGDLEGIWNEMEGLSLQSYEEKIKSWQEREGVSHQELKGLLIGLCQWSWCEDVRFFDLLFEEQEKVWGESPLNERSSSRDL